MNDNHDNDGNTDEDDNHNCDDNMDDDVEDENAGNMMGWFIGRNMELGAKNIRSIMIILIMIQME